MKKTVKISIIVIALVLAAGILATWDWLFGNPISRKIAKNSVEKHIAEQYPNENLHIDVITYNFKFGTYVADVSLDSSIDTYFTVETKKTGKVFYDSYKDSVESGWNTYARLDEEYTKKVESILDGPGFPIKSEIKYGEIKRLEKSTENKDESEYGIDESTLIRDKEYDIKEVGKTAGHIIFYAKDNEVSSEKAAELLLQIKEELDKAEISFYAIDFMLEKPMQEDRNYNPADPMLELNNFLYSEIHKDGLEKRIDKANVAK